jgi:hypothetical protein
VAGLAVFLAVLRPGSLDRSSASAVGRQVAIDLDEGTGWCKTIEATDTVTVGEVHKAAICVSAGNAITQFNFELHFNNTLDTCSNTGQTGNGLDANPDLVALGTGWDCSLGGNAYPWCNVNNNGTPVTTSTASMLCTTNDETVPPQTGWEPIAVITWTATAPGSDALTWVSGSFTDSTYEGVTGCATNANCLGATVTKLGPATATPTLTPVPPTDTPTPTQTATPAPPTATPTETATPTITNTPLPATSTFTPTATATATATATFTPTPTVWAFIDKNIGNDCNPATKQSQSTEIVGETHSLALCLANVPTQIEGFSFTIDFNADLDQCVERLCPGDDTTCLDSNPDANAGVTTFGTSLGPDWSCRIEGPGPPFCGSGQVLQTSVLDGDSLVGFATMSCERSQDGFTAFGTSFLDHITLATVDLKVIAAGTDHVVISSLDVWGSDDVTIGQCGAILADVNANTVIEGQMPCIGATDTKTTGTIRHRTATPKPTATEEPTVPPPATNTPVPPPPATPTPLGGVGTQLVPPETGSGSTGGDLLWVLALLAGTAGIAALAGGGFYLRFARRRVT